MCLPFFIATSRNEARPCSFTFRVPVKASQNIPAQLSQQSDEIHKLRDNLTNRPAATVVLAYSAFPSTRAMLTAALRGLQAQIVASMDEVKATLATLKRSAPPSTFVPILEASAPTVVILDASNTEIQDVAQVMDAIPSLSNTSIVYLYTRTAQNMHQTLNETGSPRIILRSYKPFRLLHLLRQVLEAASKQTLPSEADPKGALAAAKVRTESHPDARPKKTAASALKVASNFSEKQLSSFKTTRILIAEGSL